jgi:hypothetical protein
MSSKVELQERLAALKGELASAEGTDTEVYSRIVGYYRAVRNWNAGKREEYAHRKVYAMPGAAATGSDAACAAAAIGEAAIGEAAIGVAAIGEAAIGEAAIGEAAIGEAAIGEARGYAAEKSGVLVFTRAGCPNCPPVKDFVSRSGLAAVFVDVDKEEGVALARRHNVMSTPTVVGIDASGAESFRACSLVELKAALARSAARAGAQSAAQGAARKEAAAAAAC